VPEPADPAGDRDRESGAEVTPSDATAATSPETVPLAELRREEQARAEPHWFNFPNGLTFLRALLVPVILWLLVQDGDALRWWAFGIFVFAAATDSIDGWVARRWHGVTRWGQLADPIADKLLIIGSLASLAFVGDLPWWAVTVIVAREVAVTLLRVRLVRRLDLVMPASNWGKAKTVSQVVAVGAYLWPADVAGLQEGLLDLAVALTVWSGIEYAFRAGRLARDARPRRGSRDGS
jgi:CDP-diacylglycerol---glycerol-3-phosphate 3-phosphatidyltransferase